MRRFFDSIDTDRNGWITKNDLAIGLKQLGIDRVDDVFEHLKHENPLKIKFEEIEEAFRTYQSQTNSRSEEEEEEEEEIQNSEDDTKENNTSSHDTLKEFFDSIDTDEKGWVTHAILSNGLERFGVEAERVMKFLDHNEERIYFQDMKEAFAKLYQESKEKNHSTIILETTVRSEKLESRSQNLRHQIEELKKDRDRLVRRISFQNEYIEDQKLAFEQELENTKRRVETRSSSIVIHLQKELTAQRKMIVDTELQLDKALASNHSLDQELIPVPPSMSERRSTWCSSVGVRVFVFNRVCYCI